MCCCGTQQLQQSKDHRDWICGTFKEIPNLSSTLKLLIDFVMVDRPFHIHFTHRMVKSDLSNVRQKGRELTIRKQLPP